jgi:hypothetical protein
VCLKVGLCYLLKRIFVSWLQLPILISDHKLVCESYIFFYLQVSALHGVRSITVPHLARKSMISSTLLLSKTAKKNMLCFLGKLCIDISFHTPKKIWHDQVT